MSQRKRKAHVVKTFPSQKTVRNERINLWFELASELLLYSCIQQRYIFSYEIFPLHALICLIYYLNYF